MLDENVQKKLSEELAKLRKQEKEVQMQINLALEKENLDREDKPWFGRKDKGQSSHVMHKRRDMSSFPDLQKAREAVVQCYRYVRPHASVLAHLPHLHAKIKY